MIVPASAESESLVALNQETGKEVWRYQDRGFTSTWGTPVLVDCGQGRTDLVIAVPYKIWGFNPDTGKLRWHCDGLNSDSICTSTIAGDGIVYVLETGPRGGGTMAVRAGGEGDVSKTHVVWRGTERSRIGTPVLENKRIYFVNSRMANCLDAASGKVVYQTSPSGGPPAAEAPRAGPAAAVGRALVASVPAGGDRRADDRVGPRRDDGPGLFLARLGRRQNLLPLAIGRGLRLCRGRGTQALGSKPFRRWQR